MPHAFLVRIEPKKVVQRWLPESRTAILKPRGQPPYVVRTKGVLDRLLIFGDLAPSPLLPAVLRIGRDVRIFGPTRATDRD